MPTNRQSFTDIAIVGMSGLFAKAKNLDEYWKNIVEEIDCITEVPPSRWEIEDYYSPDPSAPDKSYSKVGGFIPEVNFNPLEFGLPPNILELTDSSQLLSLITAKAALENAGYWQNEKFSKDVRQRTGVILGVGGGQKLLSTLTSRLQYPIWEKVLKAYGVPESELPVLIDQMKASYVKWEENSFPGMLGNVIAGRITNRFDLGGTNCVVDAACAASLSAIKMAVMELQLHQVDMIITGGVDTDNSPGMYLSFSKTPAFSKNNRIRPFDDNADGIVIGEGIGMLVLKRLDDAVRDGDRIYSVIKGVGSSSDGKNKSIYAPQSAGQVLAFQRAYEQAGFDISTVDLVECHGTGTPTGDPSEFDALKIQTENKPFEPESIGLSSIKSQIGHTKSAAGAASLIKASLALYNKVLPASINVSFPNRKFNIEATPFYVNAHTRPWIKPVNHPRRAAVSAFGFGGTNFHISLEEYQAEHVQAYRTYTSSHSIILTDDTKIGLVAKLKSLQQKLSTEHAEELLLEAESQNQWSGLENVPIKFGFVALHVADALNKLAAAIQYLEHTDHPTFEHPKGFYYAEGNLKGTGKVAALFSGQGSQYVNMGNAMSCSFQVFRETFSQFDHLFSADDEKRLSKVVYPAPAFTEEKKSAQKLELTQTLYAQPAIGAVSASYYKLLRNAGFKPDMTAGHSFGELTALWASGVISEADFQLLARERGKSMAVKDAGDAGSMIAVNAELELVNDLIKTISGVVVANINAPSQIVLGGPTDAIDKASLALEKAGVRSTKLPVSAAFHTSLVQHAAIPFSKVLKKVKFSLPEIPVYSNTSGRQYSRDASAIKSILSGHITSPVLFKDEVEKMYEDGARIFVEFGPKGILSGLVKKILQGRPHFTFAMNSSEEKNSEYLFKEAVLKMRLAGVQLADPDVYIIPSQKPIKAEKLNAVLSGANYWSTSSEEALQLGMDKVKSLKVKSLAEIQIPTVPDSIPAVNGTSYHHPTETQKPVQNALSEFNMEQKNQQDSSNGHVSSDIFSQQLKVFKGMLRLMEDQVNLLESFKSMTSQFSHGNLESIPAAAPRREIIQTKAPVEKTVVVSERAFVPEYVPAPVAVEPAIIETPVAVQKNSGVIDVLLEVISDKTGYPSEMLEMEMDMEADLGIDSIKRVEIFGAMQEAFPNITGANPKEMVVLKTLSQIVNYLEAKSGNATLPVQKQQVRDISSVANSAASGTKTVSTDLSALTNAMLQVVSDKTGYPAEMLEMEMDMEADLGIDSIKRVEIFGAMQEAFPNITGANPKEMAVLKTLGQIVNYLGAKTGAAVVSAPADKIEISVSPFQNQVASQNGTAVALSTLTDTMLQVVSDKTGYPAEMLEMEMDMEADLGIDSIKRVEIFGAMQEAFPNITGANPKEMAVLKTLGQIVNYLGAKTGGSQSPVQAEKNTILPAQPINGKKASSAAGGPTDLAKLTDSMLQVVSDKTGYPAEMLEMEMDMEADLGIDSIKRVEIFGAMQEAFPNITGANPKEMAVLKTLGQIVTYLGAKTGSVIESSPESESGLQKKKSAPLIEVHDQIKRYVARLKYLPKPDSLVIPWSEQHTVLVVDDGSPLAVSLSKRLLELPVNVALLHLPGTELSGRKFPTNTKHIQLNEVSDALLEKALNEAKAGTAGISAILHLHRNAPTSSFGDVLNDEPWLRAAFFLAKHFKASLKENSSGVRNSFICVSRLDGALGFENKSNFNVLNGAYSGLLKTLSLEWPDVFCRSVDLDPSTNVSKSVSYIIDELHDPNAELKEVAYSKGARRTIVADLIDPEPDSLQKADITSNDVFLVTGGAKGITSNCIIRLAELYQPKFVLIGRSSVHEAEPQWAAGTTDEKELKRRIVEQLKKENKKPVPAEVQKIYQKIVSNREVQDTLQTLKDAGSEALYYSGDIRESARVKEIITDASSRLGDITGVIHGAGALADKLIENKTEQDFDLVFSIKIKGVLSVLESINPDQLKHFLLFSSVAGFFGNPGQSDYALSNEILNKLALLISQKNSKCKVVSYNWGPWEGGMVSPELKRLFAEKNVYTIPLDYGADIFAGELSNIYQGNTQVVIGSPLPTPDTFIDPVLRTYKIVRKLKLEENAFLNDHVIAGNAVLPVVNAVTWMAEACRQVYPGMRIASCEDPKVFKGIVFDKNCPEEFILELKEIEKQSDEILFQTQLYSLNKNKRQVFHYKASVRLSKQAGTGFTFDRKLTLDPNPAINAGEIYQDGTLFHGPSFQGISEIVGIGEKDLLIKCSVPQVDESLQGQFPVYDVNPFIIDVQYQGMLAWARHLFNAASLPVKVEKSEFYKPLKFGEEYFVAFHLRFVSEVKMIADIWIYGNDGEVYATTTGAETVLSSDLNDAFLQKGLVAEA